MRLRRRSTSSEPTLPRATRWPGTPRADRPASAPPRPARIQASSALACFALLHLALAMVGCASEGLRLDRRAARDGLDVLTLRGGDFHLRAYAQAPREAAQKKRLHLYLEGDGRPWIGGTHVAEDPHGRRAVAFELMRLDPAPALYLERPCYHRLSRQDRCSPALWTGERYSETVVASLSDAIAAEVRRRSVQHLVLVGYSGGGVLAMLVAETLLAEEHLPGSPGDGGPRLTVVTLAANLDTDAWTRHHRYLPLTGSMNPADRPPLPRDVRQLHFAGAEDLNVPPELARTAVEKQPGGELRVLPGLDHACCWHVAWPGILQEIVAPP